MTDCWLEIRIRKVLRLA